MSDPKRKIDWSSAWSEARTLVWSRRRRLGLGLLLLLVSRLSGMVLPATTKVLIDDVIGQGRGELLLWIGIAAGAATLVQASTSFSLSLLLGVAGQRAINDLRLRVQQHISRLPVDFFENHKSGELTTRVMYDAEGIRNLIGTGLVQLLGGLMTSVVALAVLLWLNWRLTLFTSVVLALFAVVMVLGFSRLRPLFRERNKLTAELTGRLTESFSGARIVKAYTAEKREERIFAHGAHKLLRNVTRSMVGVSTITSLSGLLFGLVGITMSLAGAREVLAGRMTVGDIFMFVVFTGLMISPLVQMSSIGTQITEAFAGLDRIRQILAMPTEKDADRSRRRVEDLAGEILFEDVEFEYKPGEPVLRGISFTAAAGTTTALVGPSGSGKSTITSLVMGFRHPTAGRVLVDGQNLDGLRLADYRRFIGVVLQDDFLFDGTIAENIAYSHSAASSDEIEEAGRLARCDEFVDTFPQRYQTVIGERGVKLSGGQRQRVTIARALLADPKILILDEATSSLDSESEHWIQEGLATLRRGRTTFVIAHRLSTIRNADQILVVDDGEIVERGTHDQLLAVEGRYKQLYDRQYQLESNLFINPGEEPASADDEEREEPPAGGSPELDLGGRRGLLG